MQQEDDLRGLEKVMQLMRGISVLFLLLHFYWFCYGWFDMHGCTLGVLDRLLRNVQRTTGLFTYSYLTKLFAAGFLALSCWGTRSVRSERITHRQILLAAAAGLLLFFFGDPLRHLPPQWAAPLYVAATSIGFLSLFLAGLWLGRLVKERLREDPFNDENESFMQETRLIENEYSVNLRSRYYYDKAWHEGWINAVNPFRATIVLGTPGSGKSYTVVNSFIRQQIEKGFAMYLYDFKFDDLSSIAYNHLLNHLDAYETRPKFCIINFDDPRRSNRCNPIAPEFMTDISDAYESAYTIMLNLNKTWIQKQGDFFVDSPIILLAAIIWYLKIYEGGKYCTFPQRHRIVVQTLRGHLHDPDLLSRTGKLPVALYGCVERRGAGPVAGADRFGQDTPLAHDLPAALLGDDGQRLYAGHQQPRRSEDSVRGQQSRPAEHLLGSAGPL